MDERLQFLVTLNDMLCSLRDPVEIQATAARLLGEYLQVTRVGYVEVEGDTYVVRSEYTRAIPPLRSGGVFETFGEALTEVYRRGEVVAVHDVRLDPMFTESERVTMEDRQIAAFVGVALIEGGQIVAAFGANHATPRVWLPHEIALVRDVAERTWEATARARTEATLREHKQRLQLALDASAAGVWTWDAETNRLDWDERVHAHYGLDPGGPRSLDTWVSALHKDDRLRVLEHLDHVARSVDHNEWNETFRIVRPDGTERWMHGLGKAERNTNGQLTRLVGICLDVTEHRRAEEALQARQQEEHDRELRLLLETAAQGIVSVDAQGMIVMANRALEAMFGWGAGELIGLPIKQLVPPSFRTQDIQHQSAYFAAPSARAIDSGYLVGQRKDGSTFAIESDLNHISTPGGGRAIAFITDVTDRQRAAAALQERTVELEYRTAQLSRLASDLTLAEHHAREQLAGTLHDGLQQILLVAAVTLDQTLQRDERLGIASDGLVTQARNGLDEAMAAARSLSVELYPPVLQYSGLTAALNWLADHTRTKYGLTVEVSADPLATTTRKDLRTLLFASVRELLINAVKHAQTDRVAVDLALDDDDTLCITVTDQGIGFNPATRLEQAKIAPVGWGLFSIRERLTLLGGRFEIDSAPGHGAVFRLIAPRGTVQDLPSRGAGKQASPGADGRPSTSALRTLIVDDQAAVRDVVRKVLQARPELVIVGEASNGLEAITLARALRPNVILMDISMPQMDGIEATRRLHAELPSIQILGLSSFPRTEDLHPIEQVGGAGYFVKGTDMQHLIDHMLGLHARLVLGSPGQPVSPSRISQ